MIRPKETPKRDEYAKRREQMIDWQLRARNVRDSQVLKVMSELPREVFVPQQWRDSAYEDRALPIGLEQTISQPYMVAIMTEKLDLTPDHKVLEIGTGSGYQTAILAKLAKEVCTVERLAELTRRAEQTLTELGITNVKYKVDDGSLGWPDDAPFDRIMVTAGAPDVPEPLLEQLTDEGIMIIPTGPEDQQTLMRIRKSGSDYTEEPVIGCRFVKLLGAEAWPEDAT